MLEVKWETYDEQDSHFYCPPKPKDYYVSKGIWETKPVTRESKNNSHESDLAAMLGKIIPSSNKK